MAILCALLLTGVYFAAKNKQTRLAYALAAVSISSGVLAVIAELIRTQA